MKKSLIATALLAAFVAPAFAADAAPAEPAEHTVTGNLGLFSSYRFRGIDQTFGKAAIQGGIDYAHSSGLYAGNWNSNVASGAGYPGGNLESDFYAGYKTAFGDFGLDVGALYYYYAGSNRVGLGANQTTGPVTNTELYVGGSWKFLSLKYSHALSDYFSAKGVDASGATTSQRTSGTGYLDLSANYDLGDGWGVNAHVGKLNFKNHYYGNYTDWKLGVTKDINGWILGAAYVGTTARGSCSALAPTGQPYCAVQSVDGSGTGAGHRRDLGRDTFVVSVSRTF